MKRLIIITTLGLLMMAPAAQGDTTYKVQSLTYREFDNCPRAAVGAVRLNDGRRMFITYLSTYEDGDQVITFAKLVRDGHHATYAIETGTERVTVNNQDEGYITADITCGANKRHHNPQED